MRLFVFLPPPKILTIGNLKSDAMEGIGNVSWNVGGKVTRVYKNAGSQPPRRMSFDYDVMGNRLMKRLDGRVNVSTFFPKMPNNF